MKRKRLSQSRLPIGVSTNTEIQAADNTYFGRTLMFYSEAYYMKIDGWQLVAKHSG
jgi:hypothetical protein